MTIKELRNITGLSQSQFAEKYHINIGTLHNWEQNISNPPKHFLYVLERLILEVDNEEEGVWLDSDGKPTVSIKYGYPNKSCWCSKCGEYLVGSDEYPVLAYFCPNCGKKMKGI